MVLTPPAAGVHFDSCRLGPECCGLSGPKRRLTGLREHKTGSSSSSNRTQPGTDSPAGALTRRGRRHFARLGTHIYERAAGPAAAASASVQHGCRRKRFQQASAECLCLTHWAEPRTGAPLWSSESQLHKTQLHEAFSHASSFARSVRLYAFVDLLPGTWLAQASLQCWAL